MLFRSHHAIKSGIGLRAHDDAFDRAIAGDVGQHRPGRDRKVAFPAHDVGKIQIGGKREVQLAAGPRERYRHQELGGSDRRQSQIIEHARQALARVGLDAIADRPLAQTSYGERRRVEIAMALAQSPKVLLLDEPFAGLSIDERHQVQKLLAAIPREVTVLMIEHNMDVALDLADRITLLHFGQVVVEGTRAEVVADPRTREVYLGA